MAGARPVCKAEGWEVGFKWDWIVLTLRAIAPRSQPGGLADASGHEKTNYKMRLKRNNAVVN